MQEETDNETIESSVILFSTHDESKSISNNHSLFPFYVLLARDPARIQNRAKLSRAFTIWSQRLPLQLKCFELEGQMKERVLTITSLRDNYLRDVVSVKYHIEKVIEAAKAMATASTNVNVDHNDVHDRIQNGNSTISDSLSLITQHSAELQSVPSASMRPLIDLAKSSLNPSSEFLKETLIKAGK